MAKKQTKNNKIEQFTENSINETDNSVGYKQPSKTEIKPTWEIKDRTYYLLGGYKPISATLKSTGIYYWDEEKNMERELKYTTNQQTVFVDEMKGEARLEHITFENGFLIVPKQKQTLQKLLSLYHPDLGKRYEEAKPAEEAADQIDILEMELEAMTMAKTIDIDLAEAVMRAEIGSKVSKMSSSELRRDTMIFARKNPSLFLDLVNDENVNLRNVGIKAVEANIIKITDDQRSFVWGSNNRKLMTIPFDEHPYSALAAWFKTDEGMEVFSSIEKRLK